MGRKSYKWQNSDDLAFKKAIWQPCYLPIWSPQRGSVLAAVIDVIGLLLM